MVAVGAAGAARYLGATRSPERLAEATVNGPTAGAAASAPASGVLTPGTRPDALWQLRLPDLDGTPQALAQWKGRRMVVNFWATWCAPCVKEMPDLQAMAEKHPDKQIIGIGIDSTANIRAFLQKVPVTYPLLVADTGGVDILRQLGNSMGGLPFTLILDEDGRILHHVLGQIDPADIERRLAA